MPSQTIGTGADSLNLSISEDAYRGDAQYVVRVDGRQIGGTLTATASHADGLHDLIAVRGDFGSGEHKVSVDFLNDAYDGTPDTDRNLYVDGVSGGGAALMSGGPVDFAFGTSGGTPNGSSGGTPAPASPSAPSAPVTQTVGSGPDSLVLKISQDAYQGSAQYVVRVDGHQIGGTLTAGAEHSAGQDDAITVKGDFGSGAHTATVEFLNDAYDGTPSTDRNLYVDGVSMNGADVPDSAAALMSAGPADFGFGKGSQPTSPQQPSPQPEQSAAGAYHETFDNGTGRFTNGWGHVEHGSGEVSVISRAGEWGDSGLMMGYDQTLGYGHYEFEVKSKNAPGGYALLWPGNDQWPGPELDLFEIHFGGGGYATVHWNDNGHDAYQSFDMPDLDPTQYHRYGVDWRAGSLTFYVDGRQFARTTEHVPADAAHGGVNSAPGVGEQTSWSVGAQGNTDAVLTLTDFTYSPIA
jgi:hypothetical protein